MIGLVERGRTGRDQSDMLGHGRQRRQQRKRLERGHGVAALERVDRHVQHGQMVGHEEGVELSGFELPDQLLDVGEIEIGVRPRAGIAPRPGMNADRPHEGPEPQLTFCHGLSRVCCRCAEDRNVPAQRHHRQTRRILRFERHPKEIPRHCGRGEACHRGEDVCPRSRGGGRPSFAPVGRPRKSKRAQGRPGARCTRGPVCLLLGKNAHEHTGSAEAIRPSLRGG